MYDIDKLYLTGRIFGDNGTLYHHLNKNSKLRAIGIKNKIVDGLWEVVNNPANQVSGTVAVNIDSLKKIAKTSSLASRQDSFSQFNAASVAAMIYENATGKEVIGIAAVANKGNSVVSTYYNRKLASLTELYLKQDWDGIRSTLSLLCKWDSDFHVTGMYGNLNLDWLWSWDLNSIPADIASILKTIYHRNRYNDDVDLALGELLNAAADNAKELILKKINATGEWTDVWAYALTQGYDIDYIYRVINDERLRGAMTARNIFGGIVQTKKSDIIDAFPGTTIAEWIRGAEEFSLLSGITKINQGIKTTELDYLVYSHKFEEGVTKQLFGKNNHNKTFSMQQFVLDSAYRAEMIELYENNKHTYNVLAMFAEHPLFMGMWKAYFVSSVYLQSISPRETINLGTIASKRAGYFGQINTETFKLVSDKIDEQIINQFLKDFGFNFKSLQHARNVLHKTLSSYLGKHRNDNMFTKNISYTVITPRFGQTETAALTPGIDMFEVDKNWDLQAVYAEMLDALSNNNPTIELKYEDRDGNNRRVRVSLVDALWLYSTLFYKPNASMSFTRFAEESGQPITIAEQYYETVKRLSQDTTWIEKVSNWSQNGEITIKKFLSRHLEEVSNYVKAQKLSTRVVHSEILENINSDKVKVYDETDLSEFKKLGFGKDELHAVRNARAFIYDGIVYLNRNATYSDLLHELIHIKIANLALSNNAELLSNMFEHAMNTTLGKQILANLKTNPIYENLEDADLIEEVVARYYEQYPEQLPKNLISEISTDIDTMVKTALSDIISNDSLTKTAEMQKVRTFRNSKLEDGTIERNCN